VISSQVYGRLESTDIPVTENTRYDFYQGELNPENSERYLLGVHFI